MFIVLLEMGGGSDKLSSFSIIGKNPYNISHIYTNSKIYTTQIDYIIFLDSDDYWELNCIEECVKHAKNVDTVWFNGVALYDGVQKPEEEQAKPLDFEDNKIIHPKDFIQKCIENKIKWLGPCDAFIDFNLIKNNKVRFINGILVEDSHFGLLVKCILPKKIFKCVDKFYIYRIRPQSTVRMLETNNVKIKEISLFKRKIYKKLKTKNLLNARLYHLATSMTMTSIEITKEINKANIDDIKNDLERYFLPLYYQSVPVYLELNDPFNLKKELFILKPHMKYCSLRTKFAISFPKIYKQITPIVKLARFIKRGFKKLNRISTNNF